MVWKAGPHRISYSQLRRLNNNSVIKMTLSPRSWWLPLLVVTLAACAPAATPAAKQTSAVAVNTIAPTATGPSVVTSTPTATILPPTATVVPPTSVPRPTDQQLAQLKDQILQQVTNGQPVTPDQALGVSVLPLTTTGTLSPLYAAYSTGSIMNLLPDGRHVLALYTFTNNQWNEIQQVKLENSDYVDETGVQQVMLEPSHVWLEVQSGAGAHSGCYDLIAFDPISRSVSQHIASCNSSPGAGRTADVDGDGQLDVILDATDYYVFCYACGVTRPQFSVLAWDGKQLSEVTLTTLFDTAPAEVRQMNNQAVQWARAGLWKDAQITIDQLRPASGNNSIVRWNAGLIELHAQAIRAQVEAQTYPLLNHIFYGDYAAALDVLRPYPPDQIFSPTGPLIAGTVADGWLDQLTKTVMDAANAALQAKPDLAAAYFFRGWATHLQDPSSRLALNDIKRAAQLDPNEPLYAQSVVYLKP